MQDTDTCFQENINLLNETEDAHEENGLFGTEINESVSVAPISKRSPLQPKNHNQLSVNEVIKKRRSDSSILQSLQEKYKEQMNLCIAHLVASLYDPNDPNFIPAHFKAVIASFNEDFIYPDSSKIPSLVKEAIAYYYSNLISQGFFNFCYVITSVEVEKVYFFGFAVTKYYQNVFLCCTVLKLSNEDGREQEIKSGLQKFCSVVATQYKVKLRRSPHYVIYNGNVSIDDVGTSNGNEYYRINCFSNLFKKLKTEHEKFHVGGLEYEEEDRITKKYYNDIESLEHEVRNSHLKLGEASEKVLQFFTNNPTILNISVENIIFETLTSVVLGANFMHPKYRGSLIDPTRTQKMMSDFIYMACPAEAFSALANYEEKGPDFLEISNIAVNQNPGKFWNLAKTKNKALADFALDLLVIPAIMPTVAVEKFKLAFKWEKDKDLFPFALTLIANEK